MIDFPNSPTTGQVFLAPNGVSYQWTGTLWIQTGFQSPILQTDFFANGPCSGIPVGGSWNINVPVLTGNVGGYYTPSTGVFKPPPGRYFYWAGASTGSNTNATQLQLTVYKNGVLLNYGWAIQVPATSGWMGDPSFAAVLDMNGTDTLQANLSANNGANMGGTAWIGAFPVSVPLQTTAVPAGALQLYSEQVLSAPGTDLVVTFPTNARQVQLQFDVAAVSGDATIQLQVMQSGVPYVGGTYQSGLFFQNQNTPTGNTTSSGTGLLSLGMNRVTGMAWPQLNPTINHFLGNGTFTGMNAANTTLYNGTFGWTDITGITTKSTITGYRIDSSANLQAGSYLRCYVVP